MVSYEHKVKNIYLGEPGWSPGENTIIYLPLLSDLIDKSPSPKTKTTDTASSKITYNQYGAVVSGLSAGNYVKYDTSSYNSGLTALTFGCWILGTTIKKECIIYTTYGNFGLNNNKLYFEVRGDTTSLISATESFQTNKRYYATCVRNGNTSCLYIDGIKQGEYNNSHGSVTGETFTIFGWPDNVVNRSFEGNISEIIFESKARTEQEISDYYNQTKSNYGL